MMLYNQDDLNILLKKTKQSFILFIVFLSLTVVALLLFIFLSSYELKVLFQIVGSIVVILFGGLSIYFLDRNLFFKRTATEYVSILKEEGNLISVTISSVSNKPITLADKSVVYEIICEEGKKSKTIYLSYLFEPNFEMGKKYCIKTAFNYVKDYYEER